MPITTTKQGKQSRQRIMTYITDYITLHGYAPTFREIGAGVGLKSTSSIKNHIDKLIKSGKLETDAPFGTPRAIRVAGWKMVKVG